MNFKKNKKLIFIATLSFAMIAAQTFAQKEHDHDHNEKAKNLKVLPKDMPMGEIHDIMKGFSKSLGVHCGYCHVAHEVEGQKPRMDFAADDKPEKEMARDMMKMVEGINANYISKMKMDDQPLTQITCVTCHNGKAKPITSVDSLMKM